MSDGDGRSDHLTRDGYAKLCKVVGNSAARSLTVCVCVWLVYTVFAQQPRHHATSTTLCWMHIHAAAKQPFAVLAGFLCSVLFHHHLFASHPPSTAR